MEEKTKVRIVKYPKQVFSNSGKAKHCNKETAEKGKLKDKSFANMSDNLIVLTQKLMDFENKVH